MSMNVGRVPAFVGARGLQGRLERFGSFGLGALSATSRLPARGTFESFPWPDHPKNQSPQPDALPHTSMPAYAFMKSGSQNNPYGSITLIGLLPTYAYLFHDCGRNGLPLTGSVDKKRPKGGLYSRAWKLYVLPEQSMKFASFSLA